MVLTPEIMSENHYTKSNIRNRCKVISMYLRKSGLYTATEWDTDEYWSSSKSTLFSITRPDGSKFTLVISNVDFCGDWKGYLETTFKN